MKYKIRQIINKITRGRYIKIRKILSSTITDYIESEHIEYYLDSDIGRQLYFNGEFEKKELNLCDNYINEDSTVIDIGANIGIHSLHFSRLAHKGIVLAVEPQITIFNVLLNNIKKHDNIIPINIAINSEPKISEFFIAQDNAYSSLKDTKRKKIYTKKHVVTFPFDYFLSVFKNIDFIKIDVEGFEHEAILSMKKILKKYKPTLFVEIYKGENSNTNPDNTILMLINLGYSAYYVDNKGSLVKYEKHNDNFYNYFFIYEEHK